MLFISRADVREDEFKVGAGIKTKTGANRILHDKMPVFPFHLNVMQVCRL